MPLLRAASLDGPTTRPSGQALRPSPWWCLVGVARQGEGPRRALRCALCRSPSASQHRSSISPADAPRVCVLQPGQRCALCFIYLSAAAAVVRPVIKKRSIQSRRVLLVCTCPLPRPACALLQLQSGVPVAHTRLPPCRAVGRRLPRPRRRALSPPAAARGRAQMQAGSGGSRRGAQAALRWAATARRGSPAGAALPCPAAPLRCAAEPSRLAGRLRWRGAAARGTAETHRSSSSSSPGVGGAAREHRITTTLPRSVPPSRRPHAHTSRSRPCGTALLARTRLPRLAPPLVHARACPRGPVSFPSLLAQRCQGHSALACSRLCSVLLVRTSRAVSD